MNKSTIAVLVGMALLYGYTNPNISPMLPHFNPVTPAGPVNPDVTPVDSLDVSLAKISKLVGKTADGKLMGDHFASLSEVVKDESLFKTTGDIRKANAAVGKYLFNGGFKGKYEGLKEAIESAIFSIERKNVLLDKNLRDKASTTLSKMANACYGV